MYDRDWYIRKVESVCEDEGDLNIRFMHPKGSGWRYKKKIFWPARNDVVLSLKITSCVRIGKTIEKCIYDSTDTYKTIKL